MAAATLVTLVGGEVFLLIRPILPDFIGYPGLLVGSVVGGFGSSFAWFDERRKRMSANLLPALGIVGTTILLMGVGRAVESVRAGGVGALPNALLEGLGIVAWEILNTSWWFVPAVALTLSAVVRLMTRR